MIPPPMADFNKLLVASAALHSHLCPRQVLGVRAGLYAKTILDLQLPCSKKRLLAVLETDGCFADGVAVSTGVSVGHRTMRIEDYGKIAATFIDTITNQAIRIFPHVEARQLAWTYAPGEDRHYFAQLQAYQVMPVEELFSVQAVTLTTSLELLISQPGLRTVCNRCGEEIINQREILIGEHVLCKACAGTVYYSVVEELSGIDIPRSRF